VLKAGTNVYYTNGAVRTSVNTALTLNKQRRVTRFLRAQKAMMITQIQDSSPDFLTRPVEAAFIAACHTDLEHDLRELQGFIPVASYGNRKVLCPQEIGSCEAVRYVVSPELTPFSDAGGSYNGSGTNMVTTTGVNADVYPILVFGAQSYGLVPLKGQGAITPVVINPDKIDKSDPLGQRGYVGYKTYFTCLILNQSWFVRLESAATDIT
jgi:N4-gp56 family major capsid protein